ncbi:MAG: DUF819 family protein [Spirochaetota bacterium]
MAIYLWALFYAGAPALFVYAAYKIDRISKLGTVVLAYGVGLLIGNIGVLPDDIGLVQDAMTTFTVPLALPLLFFSLDLGSWRRLAKKSVLSLVAATIAVVVGSFLTFLIFRQFLGPEGWKVGGMLVGVYTGGTPNLAAIGNALETAPNVYVAVHGSDVIVGAVLLLVFVSIGPRIFRRILPGFVADERDSESDAEFSPYFTGFSGSELLEMAKALGAAVVIFAAGGSFTLFLPDLYALPAAMLTITTLGVAASFLPGVRRLRNSFQLGYYLILVFSLAVSSMANAREIASTAPVFILYVASLLLVVSVLHLILSAIFRVDADMHLITATSFIYSPPFVPVVAAAIGNRKVIVSGVAVGVVGWVVGNYIGFAVAYSLRALF